MDRLTVEPAVVQVHHRFLRILFPTKLHIDVADQMVSEVVTHVHLLHLSVLLLHLCEDFLKELVIVLLHLHIADGTAYTIGRLGSVLRVTVNVQQGNGLAESWLVVQPRAAVPMSARSNFKVE